MITRAAELLGNHSHWSANANAPRPRAQAGAGVLMERVAWRADLDDTGIDDEAAMDLAVVEVRAERAAR